MYVTYVMAVMFFFFLGYACDISFRESAFSQQRLWKHMEARGLFKVFINHFVWMNDWLVVWSG